MFSRDEGSSTTIATLVYGNSVLIISDQPADLPETECPMDAAPVETALLLAGHRTCELIKLRHVRSVSDKQKSNHASSCLTIGVVELSRCAYQSVRIFHHAIKASYVWILRVVCSFRYRDVKIHYLWSVKSPALILSKNSGVSLAKNQLKSAKIG